CAICVSSSGDSRAHGDRHNRCIEQSPTQWFSTKSGVRIRTLANHPSLQDLNYTHKNVSHTEHYVDPEIRIRTNNIEGLSEIHIKRQIEPYEV
ncbi:hypothetical protein L914_12103, partial [Phytophthora nicotianae]